MPDNLRSQYENLPLDEMHSRAETLVKPFQYKKPQADSVKTKGIVQLGRGEIIRSAVQVVKKDGGENNLHYHTNVETLWFVLKGRVSFYGPGDKLVGELGEGEGVITPRYSRYWFKNIGEEDLEILQIAASDSPGLKSGRTDVTGKIPDYTILR